MQVELIDHSCNAVETIARSAGVCYGKDNGDKKRIARLKQHKHLATFRFAHAVFKFTDISRACQNQIVRSAHLDFLVESQRYVDQGERGFVMPDGIEGWQKSALDDVARRSRMLYRQLLEEGVPKEDARSILPANTMTSMYVAGNFQAWLDFLKLRVSKHAQAEIRKVAIYVWSTLSINFPEVFADLTFEAATLAIWEGRL